MDELTHSSQEISFEKKKKDLSAYTYPPLINDAFVHPCWVQYDEAELVL